MSEPILLTKPDAAKVLSVSIRTLEKLIKERRLKPVRFGTAVRIPRAELERFATEALENNDVA